MSKKVKAEGEYVVKDGYKSSSICFYEEEFILDDAVGSLSQARSMLQAGMMAERLRRTVENFVRVRTCQVVSFEETTESPENGDLDKILLRATELGCVPENIGNYKRPDYKIKALQNAIIVAESRIKEDKQVKLTNLE